MYYIGIGLIILGLYPVFIASMHTGMRLIKLLFTTQDIIAIAVGLVLMATGWWFINRSQN